MSDKCCYTCKHYRSIVSVNRKKAGVCRLHGIMIGIRKRYPLSFLCKHWRADDGRD